MKVYQEEKGVMVVKGWKEGVIYCGRKWWRGAREGEERDSKVSIYFHVLKQ